MWYNLKPFLRLPRESDLRERIPHTWASSNDSFLLNVLSYAAIFKEAPDWPVVEILSMRAIGNENLKYIYNNYDGA